MLNQLLSGTMQDGLLTFILGMLVVFGGIAIIVVFVSLAGYYFNRPIKEKQAPVQEVKKEIVEVQSQDELPAHVKAAIVAAISAYYFTANANSTKKCDFVVKKIKRI